MVLLLETKRVKYLSDIKIFVSSRIDVHSYCPNNSLFIPVRCGAVYDERQSSIIGDNSGDNISTRRMSFNELTVQYWAWKNTDADYYGLCHYRRFLNFSDEQYEENYHCQVEIPGLNPNSAEKYGLLDEIKMRNTIEKYDAVVVKECPVHNIPSPLGFPKTVYELWNNHSKFLLLPGAVQIMLDCIRSTSPEMYSYAKEYLERREFRGYNCFVMKKELFVKMCEFEFSVLFEVEKHLNYEHATETTQRTCGYLSEILFSIFIYYLQSKKYKIKEAQMFVFGETTVPQKMVLEQSVKNIITTVNQHNYTSAAVLLASLSKVCGNSRFHVTFMEHELLPVMKKQIREACASNCIEVTFFNPLPILYSYSEKFNEKDTSHWPFFIPWLFDFSGTLLYLDVNSVVLHDISDVFELNLNGKMIAASRDIVVQKNLNNPYSDSEKIVSKLRLKDNYAYFDSSVMVMDVLSLREKLDKKRLIDVLFGPTFCKRNSDFWNLLIRDDNVLMLGYEWNIHASWQDGLDRINNLTPLLEHEKWITASRTPKIVVSEIWRNPDSPFSSFFWHCARNTNVYERLLCEMYDFRKATPTGTSTVDHRTIVRKIADILLPKGSMRRKIAKRILPKGSRRWKFCKRIYFFVCPQYRPDNG